MTDTIYIEKALVDNARAQAIIARYPQARLIECEHYGEVFNPNAQNFRLQKNNPALILAKKHNKHVLATPKGYGIGSEHNFYFSHMLNCVYDCRYCFLQGMYRSAHYVLFINYEDFATAIEQRLNEKADTQADEQAEQSWFFSGYDCDSLALEPISGFIEYFLPFFSQHPQAHLEVRTKSTQIRPLLKHTALNNVVVAYSFTPKAISVELEHKVPSFEKRLHAMQQLQQAGWQIGLRFDPLIYCQDYEQHYASLFKQVFSVLDCAAVHSVSLGPFRLPKAFYENIVKLYPQEKLFAGELHSYNNMTSYPPTIEQDMHNFCMQEILKYVCEAQIFPCSISEE